MAAIAQGSPTGGAGTAGDEPKADLAAWLAVVAGTLGALMATLDVSIVNSALPTVQGELGATGTEGTWISTSYLIAEIVIIPMAAWLQRLLGLRTFLLIAAGFFIGFSVLCGLATNLGMMILGRVGQGFTGGAMIPTAQTIIAQRLPRSQQPIAIAFFGITAISGPVMGPLVGGWLTENMSWHWAFFLNVPICIVLMTLLSVGLPHEPWRPDLLREADWKGIIGLTLGLGGLTVLLEDGQREQWFDSSLIQAVFAISLTGFALLFWGQATAKRPIVKLKLLLDRQFGAVAMVATVLGVVLYGTAYSLPQFLSAVAGYNALQSGKVVLLSGVPSMMMIGFMPWLMRHMDIRLSVGAGLAIMAMAAMLDANLTIGSTGSAFTASQLLRGVGQTMCMLFLSQAVVRSVSRDDAGDAAGLFAAVRNLGGSLALAGIGIMQDQRMVLHTERINDTLDANSVLVQDHLATTAPLYGGPDGALQILSQQVQQQALVMTYNDIFWTMSMVTLCVLPLVFFLRPLSKGAAPAAVH